MTDTNRQRLNIAGNVFFDQHLTGKSRRRLRLIHIFKSAVDVIYSDLKRDKYKLLCLSIFPSTTIIATMALTCLGLTKQMRENRDKIQ